MTQELVNIAKTLIPSYVINDNEFFLSGLDKFTLNVIQDHENDTKEESDYGSLLPVSVANTLLTKPQDVVVHYIHVMCHKKCKQLWIHCPVRYDFFKRYEIDFIEEIYNQKLIDTVAPKCYTEFHALIESYDQILGQTTVIRTTLNTLLTRTPDQVLTKTICDIHKKLYESDPLDQATFNSYIGSWYKLFQINEIREIIRLYEFGDIRLDNKSA
jgi:hypothetical protein